MQSQESSENETVLEVQHPVVLRPGEGIVDLAVSVDAMKKRMDLLKKLKKEILTENDFIEFTVKGKKVLAIRKSGCLKYAVAFNLTTIVTKQEKVWINEQRNQFSWHIVVQCIAPNGRVVEEIGVCDNVTDRADQAEHVIKTMAKTRATSRAIIGMVGTAETTAEDMATVKEAEVQTPKEGQLCTCTLEERNPGAATIASEDPKISGLLMCKHCACPISRLVSDSILEKRGDDTHS